MQRVANDVLTIAMSTVAFESTFSTCGRHITPHCNMHHCDTLETLFCAQDRSWDEKLGIVFLYSNPIILYFDLFSIKYFVMNLSLFIYLFLGIH